MASLIFPSLFQMDGVLACGVRHSRARVMCALARIISPGSGIPSLLMQYALASSLSRLRRKHRLFETTL